MDERADLLERTKQFSLRVIRLYSALPETTECRVIGKQILRSGTSVGAHVREGKRSRSKAEMISKTEVALQELEETIYWMELLVESGIVKPRRLSELMREADELMAILVTSVKTLKRRTRK
ncbi:MAG: four helix bundle protein [Acidobacteria bacterium]|nr:four helix bundle protein [Acidobacteriota bacterium]